jgi:hypothetical protein
MQLEYLKRFSTICCAVVLLFLTPGCSTILVRHYDYEAAQAALSNGTLYVEAISTQTKVQESPPIWEYSDPFSIRIVLITNGAAGEPIEVKVLNSAALNIVTTHDLAGATVSNASFAQQKIFSATGHQCGIVMVTGNEPVTLELEILFRGRVERAVIRLLPTYSEGLEGGIGDLLMSA